MRAGVSIYDGIGLVDCNVKPHLNSASSEHIRDADIAAKVSPIYGLHDEAFLEVSDDGIKVFVGFRLFT